MTATVFTTPAAGTPDRRAGPGPVLAAMCACTALVVGMVAALNLAVPTLAAGSLHPSASALLWIVDTYVVFFACLVIPGGAAGDRFGRKGVLLAGLATFAAGALLSACATGVPMMLTGRAISGVGAACVLPNTLAILIHAVPPPRRPAAIAVWASMTGVGGMLGNVGGGAVLAAGSWRWLFAAAIPLAAGCAAAVARVAPRTPRHERPLQPVSIALLVLATLALLIGIVQGPESGWGSAPVLGGFAASVVLFTAWTITELRSAHPLLDPRLLRIRRLRGGCLGLVVMFFGMFALFYVNGSFLQYGKGYGVLRAGFGIVPMAVVMVLGARVAVPLAVRIGSRTTIAAAFLLAAGGLFGLSTCTGSTPYPVYGAYLIVVGLGVSLALPGLSGDIVGALPPAQAGVGAGLQATTREFGSALGVAVIGTIMTARFAGALPDGVRHAAHPPHTVWQALAGHPDAATTRAVLDAYVASAHTGLRTVALVTLVGGVLVVLQSRPRTGMPQA